jgi:hypothetical protein
LGGHASVIGPRKNSAEQNADGAHSSDDKTQAGNQPAGLLAAAIACLHIS